MLAWRVEDQQLLQVLHAHIHCLPRQLITAADLDKRRFISTTLSIPAHQHTHTKTRGKPVFIIFGSLVFLMVNVCIFGSLVFLMVNVCIFGSLVFLMVNVCIFGSLVFLMVNVCIFGSLVFLMVKGTVSLD